MERFAAELGEKFKVKSMVEKFGAEKTSRHQLFGGCQLSLQVDELQTPEDEEDMLKFPYREAVGALVWTATMTRPNIACTVRTVARFWKPWTGALLKNGDVGHTLPASHEGVEDHVR